MSTVSNIKITFVEFKDNTYSQQNAFRIAKNTVEKNLKWNSIVINYKLAT